MDASSKTDPTFVPSLLVSMPQLHDPNFERSVILLCEHGTHGAFGLVLNRCTDTPASAVVRLSPPVSADCGLELWIGGPVEPDRGSWILTRRGTQPSDIEAIRVCDGIFLSSTQPSDIEAIRVCDGIFLSTSPLLLRRLIEGPPQPRARLLTGYAGWGAGQLDAELAASAWLHADVDLDIVFDTRPDDMWEAAIRRLGADPTLLQVGGGGAVH